jgi:hypothetical protein
MGKIWKQIGLPNIAKIQIPVCLSEKMKRKVAKSKLSDEEIGTFFREAVSQIEQGSVLGIEELIERILK